MNIGGKCRNRRNQRRRGAVLVASIVIVMMIASMAGLLLSLGTTAQREIENARADVKAFYLAEAGLNETILAMNTSVQSDGQVAMPTAMGNKQAPLSLHGGSYWAQITDNGDGTFTLRSTGESVGELSAIEAVVQAPESESIYDHALFAGNRSEDALYALGFGGWGGQGDVINGNVFSGGNVAVGGDAVITGKIRATGSISGADGDGGETSPIPDLKAMEYEVNHDYDIASLFKRLHSIKFGDDVEDPARFRMKQPILASLIRNLVMLSPTYNLAAEALATKSLLNLWTPSSM